MLYGLFSFGFDDVEKKVGEFFAGECVVPGDGFTIYGDAAAFFIAIVDTLVVNIEGWSAREINAFADTHIETNFFRNVFGGYIFVEFFKVAVAFCYFGEVFIE